MTTTVDLLAALNDRTVDAQKLAEEVPATSSTPDVLQGLEWLVPDDTEPEPSELGVTNLIELLLKRRDALNRVSRREDVSALLLPRFLMISLLGFVFYGLAMALVLASAEVWPVLQPLPEYLRSGSSGLMSFEPLSDASQPWTDGSAIKLTMAYAFGLIAASGVCLPSLYFYSLLAGVRMSWLDVVTQSLKSKATAALALLGLLPIYAVFGLALVVFQVPTLIRDQLLFVGLCLPFVAGLFGTRSLYRSLSDFCDTMSPQRRQHRSCFLNRLVLSWAACYTAVSPVMIYTVWQKL